jgi:hypothetical protein
MASKWIAALSTSEEVKSDVLAEAISYFYENADGT